MPDDATDLKDNRSEALKFLDTFNTAPEFGMLGILQEQEQEMARQLKAQQAEKETEEPTGEPSPEPKEDEEVSKIRNYFDPINSSVQELARNIDARFTDMERRFESRPSERQQQSQPFPANLDPEAPVTMQQLWQLNQEWQGYLGQAHQNTLQARLDSARLSAHVELERYRQQNPGFNISAEQFDRMYQGHVGNDLGKATGTNWRGLFELTYAPVRTQNLQTENAELKKKLEGYEKGKGQTKKSPSEPISPSVPARRTAPAISSPTQAEFGGDDDIINLRSFQKGKSFKSFANDILAKKGIRLGR